MREKKREASMKMNYYEKTKSKVTWYLWSGAKYSLLHYLQKKTLGGNFLYLNKNAFQSSNIW